MRFTGHRRDGKAQWLWGMMSSEAAFFTTEKSRGKKVIMRLMGDYEHILTSDRYAAYNYFDSDKQAGEYLEQGSYTAAELT